MPEWVAIMVAILGALGVRELLAKAIERVPTKMGNRRDEVAILRDVLVEVRASDAAKVTRIDALEIRIEKLEERERHALTRAAVHEAWDQMAFQMLVQHNPDHPAPPPLTAPDSP